MSAPDWAERLGLEPHPEGGWFRRIYTDPRRVATPAGERAVASSIHYLLTQEQPVGHFHRVRSTILHYLQDGGPVEYRLLQEGAAPRRVVLGRAPGQELFLAVPGGIWKASSLLGGAEFALVSEVVLPGFDYADHEFMRPEQLDALLGAEAPAWAGWVRRD